MTLKRWLPTFLAFPIGGLIAIETFGALDDPLSAAAGGVIVGAILGAAQWLALRGQGIGRRWIGATAAAVAAGSALGALLTGAGTGLADVVLAGLVTGAIVGAAQSTQLPRHRMSAIAWTAVSAAAWPLGWLASAAVIDLERGFYVFGASGALLVTVLTGLALRSALPVPTPAPA